jgi:hypothetical protein
MAYMKMLGLVVLASAKGVSPTDEKHSANTILNIKPGWSAMAREAKCPS